MQIERVSTANGIDDVKFVHETSSERQFIKQLGEAGTLSCISKAAEDSIVFRPISVQSKGESCKSDNFSRTIYVSVADLVNYTGTIKDKICAFVNSLNHVKSDDDSDVWVEYNGEQLPINCEVSEWSDWSICGVDGLQSRVRTILTPASNGGTACPVLTETRSCVYIPIPVVDCVVSAWGEWSAWSSCVSNTQSRSRTRTVITSPSNGGAACPVLSESETRGCVIPPAQTTSWYASNGTPANPSEEGFPTAGEAGIVSYWTDANQTVSSFIELEPERNVDGSFYPAPCTAINHYGIIATNSATLCTTYVEFRPFVVTPGIIGCSNGIATFSPTAPSFTVYVQTRFYYIALGDNVFTDSAGKNPYEDTPANVVLNGKSSTSLGTTELGMFSIINGYAFFMNAIGNPC